MAYILSAIFGIVLMLTVADVINAYHIATGLIMFGAVTGIIYAAKFINWRFER